MGKEQPDKYCADCETHFRASVEQHAKTYHDSGFFRGIDGDYREWERKYGT